MKRYLLLAAGGAALLGACAPAYTQSRVGRIVNVTSGQEGRITLGSLSTGGARGGVVIELGNTVYNGQYSVLSGRSNVRSSFGVGASFGTYGGGFGGSGYGSGLGFFGNVGTPRDYEVSDATRQGSIIAKTAAGATLSCSFVVDNVNNGNGDCTDGAGQRYAFQF